MSSSCTERPRRYTDRIIPALPGDAPPSSRTRSKRTLSPSSTEGVAVKRTKNVPVILKRTQPRPYPCLDDKDGHLIFQPKCLLNSRYEAIDELGKGTYGCVFKCRDLVLGTYCPIKVIRAVPKYVEASKVEIRVLELLRKNDLANENSRQKFCHFGHVCMVFDLLDQSVFDFLQLNDFLPFPLHQVQRMGAQLLKSVAYLHRQRLIHTDLKPENIMLTDVRYREEMVTVLDDDGQEEVSTFEDEYHSAVVSTRHYRAPEVILGTGWSYPCDIWSVGCVLVELYTGDTLFQTHDNLEHLAIMEKVLGKFPVSFIQATRNGVLDYFYQSGAVRYNKPIDSDVKPLHEKIYPDTINNRLFLDLLRKMLTLDPAKRITSEQALKHRFFSERLNEDDEK